MAGARIGGNIPDMEGAAGVMVDTGTAATDTGTEATNVSTQMEAEVNDVTAMLSTHFNNLHTSLREALNRNRDRLNSTDWEGKSYDEALRAEADLNTQTDSFLQTAQEGVESFKTTMLTQAEAFVAAIESEYNTVMGNINTSYGDFAEATRTHADNLVNVDESFRYSG
jgi:hypothetical protein